MKRYLPALLTCLLLGIPAVTAAEEPTPRLDNELALIETWIDIQQTYDRIPGMSWAVVREQELLASGGSGLADLERGDPADADTIYGICSISKLFTGIAAMQLRDQGKFRLDAPVSELLPWFDIQRVHEGSPEITLRGLLTHSSGLPRESEMPYWMGPDFDFPTREKMRELLESQQTLYPASEYFQYSNLGLSLVGEIVAEQSGQDFESYVREHILQPMGLDDTDTDFPTDDREPRVATGYASPNRAGEIVPLPRYDAEGIAPAAGFASSAHDLAKFASWQLRVRDGKDNTVLKQNTLKEMQRVHWMDWDFKTSWGLAFGIYNVNGRTLTGHSGGCPGFTTRVYIDPVTKTGAVVMANRNNANVSTYAQTLLNILDAGGTPETEEPAGFLAGDYVGSYDWHPWGGESLVFEWDGGLAITGVPADDPLKEMEKLEHVEGDRFRFVRDDGNPGHEVRFERDSNGQVVALWRHSIPAPRIQ